MDVLSRVIEKLPDADKIRAYDTKDMTHPKFKYRGRWYEACENDDKIEVWRFEETRIPKRYLTTSTYLMEYIINL